MYTSPNEKLKRILNVCPSRNWNIKLYYIKLLFKSILPWLSRRFPILNKFRHISNIMHFFSIEYQNKNQETIMSGQWTSNYERNYSFQSFFNWLFFFANRLLNGTFHDIYHYPYTLLSNYTITMKSENNSMSRINCQFQVFNCYWQVSSIIW